MCTLYHTMKKNIEIEILMKYSIHFKGDLLNVIYIVSISKETLHTPNYEVNTFLYKNFYRCDISLFINIQYFKT